MGTGLALIFVVGGGDGRTVVKVCRSAVAVAIDVPISCVMAFFARIFVVFESFAVLGCVADTVIFSIFKVCKRFPWSRVMIQTLVTRIRSGFESFAVLHLSLIHI